MNASLNFKDDPLAFAAEPVLKDQFFSPLTYTGGKTRFVDDLCRLAPLKPRYMIEPFMGGLSATIAMIQKGRIDGKNCYAGDSFEALVNFFNVLQSESEALISRLNRTDLVFPQRRRQIFNEAIDTLLDDAASNLDKAHAYYIYNKTKFPRANKLVYRAYASGTNGVQYSQIARLPLFAELIQNIKFRIWDYRDAFALVDKLGPGGFYFLDPPYVGTEKVYDRNDDPITFDHDEFAEHVHKIANQCDFILTYDGSDEHKTRYAKYKIYQRAVIYSVGKKRTSEFVITNYTPKYETSTLKEIGYERVH